MSSIIEKELSKDQVLIVQRDEQIKMKGIRKNSANTVVTLSPQEQGNYFKIMKAYKEECGLE